LKKFILSLTVLLVISILFTGCDLLIPGDTPLSGDTNNPPGGGVLNLSDIDPTTLDPAVSTETTSSQYILQIYSGLLKLDNDLQPAPDIASGLPEISSDGLTYTFKLRQDVKFHDGRPVTANDFKYSWERAANPNTNSQTAATYLGDIVGVDEVLAGRAKQISGVQVIDEYTLQVVIDSPKSYFLYKLTYPTTFVVDKNNLASGSEWWREPNGTGPFKLGKWALNESLTLVRNNNYYGTAPQLSQVRYQFYTGLPMDLYETGRIDVTGVSTAYKDAVMDVSSPFYQDLQISPSLSFSYIGFDCQQPPFDDVNIRRAFGMAINKDKIISLIYKDMEENARGILPPGLPGYNEAVTGVGFDANRAKELIRTSKYGDIANLPPIVLTTYGYGGFVGSLIQALVYEWKQNLGVDVKVRQLETEWYFYNTRSEIDNMFVMAWIADYPHPQNFLDILFASGSNYNYGSYTNTGVDSLIREANRIIDSEQSYKLYQQAEQLIVDDMACIPLTFGKNYTLVKPYVNGYRVDELGFVDFSSVSVESR
jgi:oligopeptide transport system substrate-binding protein